jgi:hypothetical protein
MNWKGDFAGQRRRRQIHPQTRFPGASLHARLAAAMMALFPPSCAALPAVRGYFAPAEAIRFADALAGDTVTIRGTVEIVSATCTEIACPPDNPCCKSCFYAQGFTVDVYHCIRLTGMDIGCPGNDCRYDCPLLREGRSYQVDGVLTTVTGYIIYLEVEEWRPIE